MGLAPFDRHPADPGALGGSADRLAAQAAKAIDASRLTLFAFAPAPQNWDGIAAAELRAAPRPVRQQAFDLSSSLAWGAAALRYWASQVAAFNARVDQITQQLLLAKTQILGATGPDGKDLPLGDKLDAMAAVEAVARRDWRDAYRRYIETGGRTAAGMLSDGPTPANVTAASLVGVLPPGAAWNPLDQMWKAFKGTAFPPGDYGPLGPWPWYGGRLAFGVGAGTTALKYRYGYPWVKDGPGWRMFGSGPRLHPAYRSLVDRAAKAAKVGGAAATFLGALSKRLEEGSNVPEAAAGAAAETTTITGCATAGARGGAALPIPHPIGKAGAAIGGGVAGGVICSPVGDYVGDKTEDFVDGIGDSFKSLARPPWRW